jgi:hypothetical protein
VLSRACYHAKEIVANYLTTKKGGTARKHSLALLRAGLFVTR